MLGTEAGGPSPAAVTGEELFMVSLPCGIDAENQQRYSEAQIPDLVANANPKVLEASSGRSRLLPQNRRKGRCDCAVRPSSASNLTGLAFASSSADGRGRAVRGHCSFTQVSRVGGC